MKGLPGGREADYIKVIQLFQLCFLFLCCFFNDIFKTFDKEFKKFEKYLNI